MLGRGVAAAGVIALLAAGDAGAAGEQEGASCRQRGERVIARNTRAEVVATVAGPGEYLYVFGCLKGDPTRRSFDTCECDYVVHAIKLHGARALYTQETFLGEDLSQDLVAIDLRDGKLSLVDGRGAQGKQFGRFGFTRSGVVAYLVRTFGRWKVSACAGMCLTGDANPRTVAAGPGIDPDYLRIRGDRVFWRQRGRIRSAPVRR